MIFRFDDICINCDMDKAHAMAEFMVKRFDADIWFCVSPMVSDMSRRPSESPERVFAGILKAYSDYRRFYEVDKCGVPSVEMPSVKVASHGLVHVDHRLLAKEAQELSILSSCSLLKTKLFVPPFNKWNLDTEIVCAEHGIALVKFEDGWLSMECNDFIPTHDKWYLHSREWTPHRFKAWFNAAG